MRRQLLTGLGMLVAMTLLLGLAYPLAMTGVAQVAFDDKANGSLVERDGTVVGSKLLGQNFSRPEYFQPRPSAAGDGYDGLASSASNLGPSSDKLLSDVEQRVATYRQANGLGPDSQVPVDAVTTSASGLDPDISVANARIQARRVASVRGLPVDAVQRKVDAHTQGRPLGVLGEKTVNVLELNLDLDA
ncbi:MAG: potassium-transporting ATPase subunit KdpC [Actinomycetota bacterium]|nr:potassium-transporting ATPase subunit KdpC [Actinomycetota bacterium]